MARIYRPCYCTREEVMRAMDVQLAAYSADQVDRAILASADAVEGLTQRVFYPTDETRSFDWPNFQSTYPYRLYLEQNELAAQPTQIVTGYLNATPTVIPSGDYIVRPAPESPPEAGPPYRVLELRRDTSAAFGSNSTPQQDIGITGTWGYWTRTRDAGSLDGAITSSDGTLRVSDSNLIGVGDVLVVDSERMLVNESSYEDTGISFLSGITAAQVTDRIGTVTDGTAFSVGETIMVDYEWMLIQQIVGNNVVVKRAVEGSLLASHGSSHIYARRVFSVLRGQLGTSSATHSDSAALTLCEYPALIRELAIGEALVWLTQEPAAYGGGTGQVMQGAQRERRPGAGLPDLRQRVLDSRFTRKARSRAV